MKHKVLKMISIMIIFNVLSLCILSTNLEAVTSSTSSASSSSSSSSSAVRSSTSSSSSMSRSSTMNASRVAKQSSQHAAQQASRTNSITYNNKASKFKQDTGKLQSQQARSMVSTRHRYRPGASYTSQFMATSYYNNWLYFYFITSGMYKNKTNHVEYQKNMLKQQMKAHEKLYTITVQTNKGKRLVVVPKKQYDKIKTGEKVKIKNSVLQ